MFSRVKKVHKMGRMKMNKVARVKDKLSLNQISSDEDIDLNIYFNY